MMQPNLRTPRSNGGGYVGLLLACAVVLAPSAARAQNAAAAPSAAKDAGVEATQQTQALIKAYRGCCQGATQQGVPCKLIDRFFDYRLLAEDTMVPLRKSMTPRQQTRLAQALERIFTQTARQSGKSFCQVEPRIVGSQQQTRGTQVQVEVTEPGEDVPTQFAFVWRRIKGQYRVVDLTVEGGSLIVDYQNQFMRIQRKEGVSGLLRRVEARLATPAQ